jgi:hypothetical protein
MVVIEPPIEQMKRILKNNLNDLKWLKKLTARGAKIYAKFAKK